MKSPTSLHPMALTAFFLALLSSLIHCGNISFQTNETLDRPVGLSVYAEPGGIFTFTYYVQNTEATFDGYNLYMSRESLNVKCENARLSPYTFNGAVPTFVHSAVDADPMTPVTVSIDKYLDIHTDLNNRKTTVYINFEPGIRYHFMICAHSRFGLQSEPSNKVSAVALP